MKIILLIIILVVSSSFILNGEETIESPYLSEELIISFGIFNDNLLCTYEAAREGYSWGPDDIFSFGGDLRGIYKKFMFGIDYIGVTSRKLLYRFDFIKITTLYSIPLAELGFYTLGGGFLYTGWGPGEAIQNKFHDIISYPHVNVPFLENRLSGLIRGGISLDFFKMKDIGIVCRFYNDEEVFIPEGPHQGKMGVSCMYSSSVVDIEALGGIHQFFLLPDYFDQLLRSGIYGGIALTAKISSVFAFTVFVGGIGIKNATDDPSFIDIQYPYMPLIRILFSYGKSSIPIRELFLP